MADIGINSAERIIEEDDLAVIVCGSRNADSLTLPSRQGDASLANLGPASSVNLPRAVVGNM